MDTSSGSHRNIGIILEDLKAKMRDSATTFATLSIFLEKQNTDQHPVARDQFLIDDMLPRWGRNRGTRIHIAELFRKLRTPSTSQLHRAGPLGAYRQVSERTSNNYGRQSLRC